MGEGLTKQELKLTAALYAQKPTVMDHLRVTGSLPARIDNGGMQIAMRLLIERRGKDINLTESEQRVFDLIIREGRLPGGVVRLVH